ncbi:MAG: TIR domain-containing protein [Bdellovibrionaceae bacterium]|nr:TIR domain-containing protein [Pseudobdellovibrionaceae bacterium]
MAKKGVFVSFDFDNDRILKEFLIGQSKLEDSPFSVVDHSLKEEKPEATWEAEAEKRIKRCDLVIVMVGDKTHAAPGVKKEVAMAAKHQKKIVQIIGYKDGNPTPVPNAGTLYKWNWENLKNLLR